jgi:ADP-ribose pyrophosphatase YjhB (NUDIX family)
MTLAQVKLIVDVTLLAEERIALLKYAAAPDEQGQGWFLPNTQLTEPEDPYEAAQRVVKAQTGVGIDRPILFDLDSFIGRDGTWHLAAHFRSEVPPQTRLTSGEGVAELRWFSTGDLPDASTVAHRGWYLGIIKRALRPR